MQENDPKWLKTQIHRLELLCDTHRVMGENAEAENRELKRKIEDLKARISLHSEFFNTLAMRIRELGSDTLKADLARYEEALSVLKDLLSRI